ncbi:MAG: AAA family ATPase, partial [Bacteroidales bacterium]|nr:AAA family ATPase [Bacteroidales bacterium]
AGLQDEKRPIGSFIFLGSTGVGKTELAKALAEFMFDDENMMTRIDMSEYQEKHSVSRLVGAPPGYVGYDEGGQLTEAVRRKPYSVILLDEIEKAHPDTFNILLQVLEDGRLTDNKGRTANFKNTIIIMTSNLGSQYIQEQIEKGEYDAEKTRQNISSALKSFLRPEFINRIDETIIFKPLEKDQIANIVKIQIQRLTNKMAEQNFTLNVDDDAISLIAENSYDPQNGARPIKRYIQREIENRIAKMIIGGEIPSGGKIRISGDNEKLQFISE